MSQHAARYRINHPNVVGEEFDREVVAVDLISGTYFSLPDSAGVIWVRVAAGDSVEDIATHLRNNYSCGATDISAVVTGFLSELEERGLIVPAPEPDAVDGSAPHTPAPVIDLTDRPAFRAPQLEAFADLQDILLLDPIHDVDEAGWPVAAPVRPPAE